MFPVNKPADRVAGCIQERYDGMGMSRAIRATPRGDGGTTIKRVARQGVTGEVYAFVADVVPIANTSELRVYDNYMVMEFDRKIFEACTH